MSTLELKTQPGTRRRINRVECVWTGAQWVPVARLEERLRNICATANYNTRMGAPRLASLHRNDAAHIRGLINGAPT